MSTGLHQRKDPRPEEQAVIQALFLTCALALPSPSFRNSEDRVMVVKDMLAINRLLTMIKNNDIKGRNKSPKRILMIGGKASLVELFMSLKYKAVRILSCRGQVTITSHDIIANAIYLPIKRRSQQIVIFYYISSLDPWKSMEYLGEVIQPVCLGGFFIFDKFFNKHFSFFLRRMGFSEIPMDWMGMSVFKREYDRTPGKIHQMDSGA